MKRFLTLTLAALALLAGLAATAPPAAADETDNEAVAVNTQDGSSVFRFALSIREVSDGVIDQTNTASAQASCVDCATVAVAFQVILVNGDGDFVAPENRAEAVNVECTECLTYAAATQIVIDMDGKELTDNGKRRLKELDKRMRAVERNANNMTDAELLAAAQEAERELIAIFNEELVPIGSGTGATTTTTTTTSTTSPGDGTTSTTERTTTTSVSPSTTDAPSTTPTTEAAA